MGVCVYSHSEFYRLVRSDRILLCSDDAQRIVCMSLYLSQLVYINNAANTLTLFILPWS